MQIIWILITVLKGLGLGIVIDEDDTKDEDKKEEEDKTDKKVELGEDDDEDIIGRVADFFL